MTPRKADRLNTMLECLDRAGASGLNRREFAQCLGLKVTPYLSQLLETLIQHGYAQKSLDNTVYPPAWRYYPIAQDTN
jgi:DNA-binding IclR family transcriptional regulator